MLKEFEIKREDLFLESKADKKFPGMSDEQLMQGLSVSLYSSLRPADKLLFRREIAPISAEFKEIANTGDEFEHYSQTRAAANHALAQRQAATHADPVPKADPVPPADPLREANARAVASLERMAASSAASLSAFQGNPMCTPMGWPAWAPPFGQSQAPQTPSTAPPQRPQAPQAPQAPFASTVRQERTNNICPQFQAPPVAPFQIQRPQQAAVQARPVYASTSDSSSCCHNPCSKIGPYTKLGAGVATVAGLTVGSYLLTKHLTV